MKRTENRRKNFNNKNDKYISPFILEASKIAAKRSKDAAELRLKISRLNKGRNEWDLSDLLSSPPIDQNTSISSKNPAHKRNDKATGLFDPTLRKKEIFRIEPKRKDDSQQKIVNDFYSQGGIRAPVNSDNNSSSHTNNNYIDNRQRPSTPSVVIRTKGASPVHAEHIKELKQRLTYMLKKPQLKNYQNEQQLAEDNTSHTSHSTYPMDPNTYHNTSNRPPSPIPHPTHPIDPNTYHNISNMPSSPTTQNAIDTMQNVAPSQYPNQFKSTNVNHFHPNQNPTTTAFYNKSTQYPTELPPNPATKNPNDSKSNILELLLQKIQTFKSNQNMQTIQERLAAMIQARKNQSAPLMNDSKSAHGGASRGPPAGNKMISHRDDPTRLGQMNATDPSSVAFGLNNDLVSSMAKILNAVGDIMHSTHPPSHSSRHPNTNKTQYRPERQQNSIQFNTPLPMHREVIFDNNERVPTKKSIRPTNPLVATPSASLKPSAHNLNPIQKTKAVLLDTILQKIEALEANENEIRQHLMTQQDLPLLKDDDKVKMNTNHTTIATQLPFLTSTRSENIRSAPFHPPFDPYSASYQQQFDISIINQHIEDSPIHIVDPHALITIHDNPIVNWLDHLSKSQSNATIHHSPLSDNRYEPVDINIKKNNEKLQINSRYEPNQSNLNLFGLMGYSSSISRERYQQQYLKKQEKEKKKQYLQQFPNLQLVPYDSKDEIYSYKEKLFMARKMKDVPFHARGITMAETADKICDMLLSNVLEEITGELENIFTDYSEQILDKI